MRMALLPWRRMTIKRRIRLGRIMTAHPMAWWFETHGVAALLTKRV
jgi:hypothetical protein